MGSILSLLSTSPLQSFQRVVGHYKSALMVQQIMRILSSLVQGRLFHGNVHLSLLSLVTVIQVVSG
jgi:hypothetical protein